MSAFGDPGFGVYVHWPFCASKCPYCDFNSHVRAGGIDEARFTAAYAKEIAHMAQLSPSGSVSSIFFGGGTPSLMSPTSVGAILDEIGKHWPVEDGAEITLEANPSSVEAERFSGYRAAGVNRVSLGVQSLVDRDLKTLGRLHTAAEARAAIEIARGAFERFSFDLIYARPKQDHKAWRAELAEALALAGGHVSAYQLTIEDGTPFAALHKAGRLTVPEGGPAHDLFELTQEMMDACGLPAYEISNHAAPGEESRHNLLYWRYGTYAGVGAGAHGRLVVDGARIAAATVLNPERWLEQVERRGHGLSEQTALGAGAQADEMLLMGLRLRDGVDLTRMQRLTGLRPSEAAVKELTQLGLIAPQSDTGNSRFGHIKASSQGRFVLNKLVLALADSLEPAGY